MSRLRLRPVTIICKREAISSTRSSGIRRRSLSASLPKTTSAGLPVNRFTARVSASFRPLLQADGTTSRQILLGGLQTWRNHRLQDAIVKRLGILYGHHSCHGSSSPRYEDALAGLDPPDKLPSSRFELFYSNRSQRYSDLLSSLLENCSTAVGLRGGQGGGLVRLAAVDSPSPLRGGWGGGLVPLAIHSPSRQGFTTVSARAAQDHAARVHVVPSQSHVSLVTVSVTRPPDMTPILPPNRTTLPTAWS